MKVKTKTRYHLAATRMTIIKTKMVLIRMWRSWGPNTLLIGMYSDATTLESGPAVSQEAKQFTI